MGFPYDYNSLLHYPDDAWSFNGQPVIVPKKPGVEIPYHDGNSRLSPIDIAEVKKLYRCK